MTNFTRRRWFRILVAVGLAMVLLFIAAIVWLTSGVVETPFNIFMASDHEMSSHAYQDYRDGR
jgi:hypothetical protein